MFWLGFFFFFFFLSPSLEITDQCESYSIISTLTLMCLRKQEKKIIVQSIEKKACRGLVETLEILRVKVGGD